MNFQTINSNNFQGATTAVVLGMTGNGAKSTSVKVLGKLPKGVFATKVVQKESGIERFERALEQKRFTVEALRKQITEKIGLSVRIASDHRGAIAGGFVKLIVGTGTEVRISTLPVERDLDGVIYTEYYVWEITVEGSSSVSPRAGRGRADLENCVRFVRREINGY